MCQDAQGREASSVAEVRGGLQVEGVAADSAEFVQAANEEQSPLARLRSRPGDRRTTTHQDRSGLGRRHHVYSIGGSLLLLPGDADGPLLSRIVGHRIMETMTKELEITVTQQAIRAWQPKPGLILHSDRGRLYASHRLQAFLSRHSIRPSMSCQSEFYDNAFMESCFGTFKQELEMTEFDSIDTAIEELIPFLAYYT